MITISYKGLTPKGYGKIRSIGTLVPKVARVSLRKHFYPVRNAIVRMAPTLAEEAVELSRGVYASGLIGDPGSGRFSKTGGQRSVQAALAEERPVVAGGATIALTWGSVPVINSKIGFSWTTSRGQTSKTNTSEPLWGNLIQAWEGTIPGAARITSRGPYPLRPENNLSVPYMDKVVPPYHMVRKGYNMTRTAFQQAVRADIKKAVQKVGLK